MSNRMTLVSARAISSLILAGIIGVSGASPVRAQTAGLDTRWQPWLGCWQSSDSPAYARSSLVCVIPAGRASPGVNVITLANGKELSREQLEATGGRVAVAKDGCNGWETAQWSADNRRVYLQSELTCADGVKRTSSGLIAMSAEGEWIDVKDIAAGRGSNLWGMQYRDAGTPAGLPAEITTALSGTQLSTSTARAAAGAPIGLADIIDASKHLEPGLVQGWLVARGQPFKLDARRLTALADNGVPGSVTDVMLALTYPKVFSLDAGALDQQSNADFSRNAGVYRGVDVYADRYGYGRNGVSPFGWGMYSGYGYSPYGSSGYGYSPFGYSPYGYSPYGYGYGGRSPYIIVTRGGAAAPRGRAINGHGYTRGDESNGSGRTSVSRPRSSSGSSGGGRPASSGGRTAKPRH